MEKWKIYRKQEASKFTEIWLPSRTLLILFAMITSINTFLQGTLITMTKDSLCSARFASIPSFLKYSRLHSKYRSYTTDLSGRHIYYNLAMPSMEVRLSSTALECSMSRSIYKLPRIFFAKSELFSPFTEFSENGSSKFLRVEGDNAATKSAKLGDAQCGQFRSAATQD